MRRASSRCFLAELFPMSFTGGKLKLKGGSDLPGIKKKKKKSDAGGTANALALAASEGGADDAGGSMAKEAAAEDLKKVLHGHALTSPDEMDDRRTAAERKYDEHMKKLEGERLRKLATKSHRWGEQSLGPDCPSGLGV